MNVGICACNFAFCDRRFWSLVGTCVAYQRFYLNVLIFCFCDGFAVMKNPANLAKHQANPKVAPIIAKMMGKFGGPQ